MTTPEQKRAWYLANRELTIARARTWKDTNPERKNEHQNKHRLKFLDRHRAYQKKFWLKNLERMREYHKLISRKWRNDNPQKVRDLSHRYKLRKRHGRVDGQDCAEKIKLLIKERFCRWCYTRLTPENWSIDHVIPLARGGKHIPDNLVASCRTCNCSKTDKLVEEWEWKTAT